MNGAELGTMRGVSRSLHSGAPARGTTQSELLGPMTLTVPPISLPAVTVQAAPPLLITRRNAAHLGMSGNELLRILREMRADPRFRDRVISRGKSFRAAPPDAILAFLQAVPVASENDPVGDVPSPDAEVDTDLLRAAGYALEPAVANGDTGKGTRTRHRARAA